MPDSVLLRIYLDANILFSATHSRWNSFLELWAMPGVVPTTSNYAIGEVRRNLRSNLQRQRLDLLLAATDLIADPETDFTPRGLKLVAKDRPILSAAIATKCNYLITGDLNHFRELYGTTIEGVHIITAYDFRQSFKIRLDLDMLAYNFSEATGW